MRVKVIVILILCFMLVFKVVEHLKPSKLSALEVKREWGYSNTVTTIYLKSRMLDTVFEVLVFSTVVLGLVAYHTGGSGGTKDVDDEIFKKVARSLSFFILLASLYLGMTGHLYPGGGFTAGAAGGTALMLMAFARGYERFEEEFERYKVDKLEKFFFGLIPLVTILEFWLKLDRFIILQNLLIYFKVMAGTWIIVHNLLKHRGIV